VALVNLSRGGALLHSPTQLRPGVTMVLELLGERAEAIPFKVLRCEVARIGPEGAVYRGACQFTRPLQLAALQSGQAVPRPPLPADKASAPRAEIALRRLLLRHREELAAPGASFAEWTGRLPHALRSIQAAASSADPLSYALRELLAEIVPALDRGEPAVALRARLESHLRRTIPNITVAIAASPLQGPAGTESIYFAAGEHDACEILNVSLPADWTIPDWQFRLLQAGSQLLEIVSAAGAGLRTPAAERVFHGAAAGESSRSRVILPPSPAEAAAEATPGWQKIVVRYRDGNLLKGFTHDFHPSRTQFSLWSSLSAPPSERKHIPLSQLKAVFFVRDFAGNPGYQEQREFDGNAGGGRRLEVTFADGEQLVGSTLSYRPDGVGFFMIPADPLANNQRVFVVTGAVLHLRFL
jgi:hypothetical protein